MPGELHFLLRQTIKEQQYDHARDTNLPRNRRHHFVFGFWRVDGKITPAIEVVRGEVPFLGPDHLGVALVEKRKGATSRADINRLPQAVEHQDLTVK